MTSSPLNFACPAKLNLALSVGPPDPRGFHPVCSWMVKIDFFDDLEVTRLSDDAPSTFRIEWAHDAPHPTPIDWPIASDLTCMTCQLTEHYVARPLPVAVHLRKRIPTGAGLAGGSSDAVATLRALDRLFDLDLGPEARHRIASALGSDVAFFLEGHSALAQGRGEILTPLPLARPLHFTLILPALQCPTGRVYQTFDRIHPHAALDENRVRRLAADPAPDGANFFNDLADAACAVQPALADLRRACAAVCGRPVHVTGSGAAMFVAAQSPDQARELGERISGETGVRTLAVKTATDPA